VLSSQSPVARILSLSLNGRTPAALGSVIAGAWFAAEQLPVAPLDLGGALGAERFFQILVPLLRVFTQEGGSWG